MPEPKPKVAVDVKVTGMTKKKSRSRSARRTGSPVGSDEVRKADDASEEYVVTEESYEVEAVVGHRMRRHGMEYKVRWRGWSEQFDEWLPDSKMDCPDAIQAYWDSQKHQKQDEKTPDGKKREHRSTSSNRSVTKKSPPPKKTRTSESETGTSADATTSSKKGSSTKKTRASESETSTNADADQAVLKPEPTTDSTPRTRASRRSAEKDKPMQKPSDAPSDVESQATIEETASEASDNVPLAAKFPNVVKNDRASPCTSVSSTQSVPPLVIKRKIPRPPALPKRKSFASTASLASPAGGSTPASPKLPVIKTAPDTAENLAPQLEISQPEPTAAPEINDQVMQKDESSCDSTISSKALGPDTEQKADTEPSLQEKRFVRPHGFERGLSVERIHMFLKRADRIFAVVQFKNCDTLEVLATQIVQHYEPLALIRGFEELHIRCRQNEILARNSSQSTES
ncbi:unnamed protein product [Cylicocyclus nassatus]|uniref:Chromo domain-containing protein n=1 Tax=Cylicocyclus nassatus TaxID=53992 RepID=A0AA36DTL4_CYLNA|nr:unnamed protein product [Cylicocyclus nassatus]